MMVRTLRRMPAGTHGTNDAAAREDALQRIEGRKTMKRRTRRICTVAMLAMLASVMAPAPRAETPACVSF